MPRVGLHALVQLACGIPAGRHCSGNPYQVSRSFARSDRNFHIIMLETFQFLGRNPGRIYVHDDVRQRSFLFPSSSAPAHWIWPAGKILG